MYKGYEGDCVEIIPTIEEIPQLIICDGPFGPRMSKDSSWYTGEVDGIDWFKACHEKVDPKGVIVVFVPTQLMMNPNYTAMCNYRPLTNVLTWTHSGWNDIERGYDSRSDTKKWTNNICIFGQQWHAEQSEYIGHYPIEELKYHPHQKPVGVYQYLIDRYSKDGDTILDPFAGSGICAKACKNRDYIAIDFDLEPLSRVMKDINASLV